MVLAIDQGLPTFFHAHLHPDQAVTISRRITISNRIADAYIVAATSSAALWYGVEDPNDLLGGWLSLLQHPDDSRLGRILALARHCGLSTPKRYVSRIRQIRDEMFRPVTKEVTQVILGRETYFVTTLTEPETPPLADKQGIFEQYAVDPVKSEAFLGLMSVADIDHAIQGVHAEPQASLPPSAMPFHPHYGLELGATVRLDEQNYAHRCAKCAGVWHSAEAEPERCGKRGCQVGKWRNLKEPFRSMRLEGHLVTPDMIRRAWDQRPRRRKRHQH